VKAENLLLDTVNDKGKQSDYKYEQEVATSIPFFSHDIDARRLGSQLLILAGCAPDEKGIEHPVLGKVNSIDDLVTALMIWLLSCPNWDLVDDFKQKSTN
jgi:hypothetical protein